MTTTSDTSALIESHLPLVRNIVLQVAGHFPRHVDRQELAHAGALGLVEAARRYESDRGVPFDRFAARRIRGAILDAVRAVDWAPRSVRALSRELDTVEYELANRNGSQPSEAEVATAMGITATDLIAIRDRVYRSVVLALEHGSSGRGDDGEDVALGDVIADRSALEPAESLEARELLGYLRDAIDLLPERHRVVIVGYFLDNRTSLELADDLAVTESRISQIRSEALEMLRNGIDAQYAPMPEAAPVGRTARRKADYATAISSASEWRDRLVSAAS